MQLKAEKRKVGFARWPTGVLRVELTKHRLGHLLLVAVIFGAGISLCDEPGSLTIHTEPQEQVAHLLPSGNGGDGASRGGANFLRNSADAETALREGSIWMPGRLDLRFGAASSLISQALQKDGKLLETKVREALIVYEEIRALDPDGFEAPMLYAAYARAIGDTNASREALVNLAELNQDRTQKYRQKFDHADRILQNAPNEELRRSMPSDPNHTILVLGAGLEKDGTTKPKLIARLQQALILARIYPQAPIILSGGNPRRGVTEAYAMRLWLRKNAIPESRLILEDRSTDTVGNALWSSAILLHLGTTHVTLVTSSSHVRRALVDLQEACCQLRLNLEYDTLAAPGGGDAPLDPQKERLGVYRDLMRVSGFWDLPGVRR
jgi:hypothetical protein